MKRTQEEIDNVIGRMIDYYEHNRSVLGWSKEDSKKWIQDSYFDFYDWLNKIGDFENDNPKKS